MNNMRTRKNKYKGGTVFEGSEGCVFTPELKSKDGLFISKYPTRSGKFVTKIYVRPEDMKTEIQGIGLMKQVDPTGQYTKTFVDIDTKPDIKSILPTEQCTKPINADSPALYMYYAGVSLQSLKKAGLYLVLKDVLLGLSNLVPLFTKMSELNIYHTDVHPGNLLYNRADKRVYLIDFTSMKLMPGVTDKSTDIRSLAIVIFNILVNYRRQIQSDSKCGNLLDIILSKSADNVAATRDVEVIGTIITSTVTSVVATCLSTGGRKRTLRRKVNRNVH
jgi:hypothetical protein